MPCYLCGAVTNNPKFTVFSIRFYELKGQPRICSKCVFKKLTGSDVDWQDEIKEVTTYAPSNTTSVANS